MKKSKISDQRKDQVLSDLTIIREEADNFVKTNLAKLCADFLFWKSTGKLPERNKVEELATILAFAGSGNYRLAENMIGNAAMEKVVKDAVAISAQKKR